MDFVITIISCSQCKIGILLNESSEYFFTNGHELLCWEVLWSLHRFFFLFFYKWLVIIRDKIRDSMSLDFSSVPSWIHDLIVLTIFSLELKPHKKWSAFHPYLFFPFISISGLIIGLRSLNSRLDYNYKIMKCIAPILFFHSHQMQVKFIMRYRSNPLPVLRFFIIDQLFFFGKLSNIVKEQITQFLLGTKLSSNLSTIGRTCSWITLS